MKAIILSAGQGSRLLPLTEDTPKCLLPIGGRALIEHQIHALHAAGIREIAVVTGFCAGTVDRHLSALSLPGLAVSCVFNPFFNVADNLASCWMAREHMGGDFLIVNGDTLFDPGLCERLLEAPPAPITLAIDRKSEYDSDDMKVVLEKTRLLEIGKHIELERVDGESIGMIRFQAEGARAFHETIDQVMHTPNSLGWWYLKAIGILAERMDVQTRLISGMTWCEVDFPHDLERACALFEGAGTG